MLHHRPREPSSSHPKSNTCSAFRSAAKQKVSQVSACPQPPAAQCFGMMKKQRTNAELHTRAGKPAPNPPLEAAIKAKPLAHVLQDTALLCWHSTNPAWHASKSSVPTSKVQLQVCIMPSCAAWKKKAWMRTNSKHPTQFTL